MLRRIMKATRLVTLVSLSVVPLSASTEPLLEWTSLNFQLTMGGDPEDSAIWSGRTMPREWTRAQVEEVPANQRGPIASQAFVIQPGLAPTISVRQVPEGIWADAGSVASTVEVRVDGRYRLTERADLTLNVFRHSVTQYAVSFEPVFSSADMTTTGHYAVENFRPVDLPDTQLSVSGREERGSRLTPASRGPFFETVRNVPAGEYMFDFTLFARASATAFADAFAAIDQGGFSLTARVPAPSSLALLSIGMLAVWATWPAGRRPRRGVAATPAPCALGSSDRAA